MFTTNNISLRLVLTHCGRWKCQKGKCGTGKCGTKCSGGKCKTGVQKMRKRKIWNTKVFVSYQVQIINRIVSHRTWYMLMESQNQSINLICFTWPKQRTATLRSTRKELMIIIMLLLCYYKKAELSQRWSRGAPYIWVPWTFLGVPQYAHGYFSGNF